MQTHKKLVTRLLSLALSVSMVITVMSATVFATGDDMPLGASSIGTIQSFDRLDSSFDPSMGKDAPEHVYSLSVELDTPEEELNLPTELAAMVARATTVSTAPDAEDEEAVIGAEQEAVPVTWSSDKEYKSDEKGQFIYTAKLSQGYILADGVELPQIYVFVGRQTRTISAGDVASIGDAGYDTLQKAFDAVADGEIIKILRRIDLVSSTASLNNAGASVTLDLNGNTITYSGTSSAIKLIDGSLEITDTASGGTVSATAANGTAINNRGTGAVTISGGTVSATAANGYAISNHSTGAVTVSGGTVSATANLGWAIYNEGAGNVTVSGGTVSATTSVAIDNHSTGAVTISGGTVSATGNGGTAIFNYATGTVTISGGTVSATTGYAINNNATGTVTISQAEGKTTLVTSANTDDEQGTVYLNAGAATDTVLTITGGTVRNTATPEGYSVYNCASGIMDISLDAEVGKVYPTLPVAEIAGTKYTSLQDAFTAVADGQTIKILSPIDLGTSGVTLDKADTSVKLDLNGNTITSGSSSAIKLTAGSLEITDTASGGTVSATAQSGKAIDNYSTGAVTVSSGTVSATTDVAIDNHSTGAVTISGGTVSATGNGGTAIFNYATGTVTVSGGTVSATTGMAIVNYNTGTVNVSGGTVSATTGTAIDNNDTGAVNISGGTVSAIASIGKAIYNSSTGTITISGGTVSAIASTGRAIYNYGTGHITISQAEGKTTLVTSANTDDEQGSVYLFAGATNDTVLTITGGTVRNTATPEGYSVYNKASGIMDIGADAEVGKVYPEPETPPTPTPTPPPTPGGGGGSSSAPSQTIDSKGATNVVSNAIKNAIAAGTGNTVTTRATFNNFDYLALDGLKTINDIVAKEAAGKSVSFKLNLDAGPKSSVTSRITLDPLALAKELTARKLTDRLPLGVYFDQAKDTKVQSVNDLFGRYFTNKIVSVVYDRRSTIAVNAEFCAKLDLAKTFGQDKQLYFYSYDNVKNIYNRIVNPGYWVDKNGYAHINAPLGGSIIISDKPLMLR